MNATVRKNEYGNWTAPLPLQNQVIRLPESYNEALKQLKATRKSLDFKPKMKDHYFSFVQKILDNGHAERVHGNEIHTSKPNTHSRICATGYWIIGGKRLTNRIIHKCVPCRKLRGRLACQKMADLPRERLTPSPPFTYVGLDVFGPWEVVTRCARGRSARNKHWAVIFTCLTVTAVHIEIIKAMDTPSFLNALCRFLALRGPVAQFRSDRGTNFIRARTELAAVLQEMKNDQIT